MSRFGDLSAMAVHACGAAGATTQAAGGGGGGLGLSVPWLEILGFLAVFAGLALLGIAVAIAVLVKDGWRSPMPVAVPIGARWSPDGHYWWDGATWRPR